MNMRERVRGVYVAMPKTPCLYTFKESATCGVDIGTNASFLLLKGSNEPK